MLRFILVLFSILPWAWLNAAFGEGTLEERLRFRLELMPQLDHREGASISLINPEATRYLYGALAFQSLWLDAKGQLNIQGRELLRELQSANSHGLDAEDYHVERIERLVNENDGDPVGRWVDLELLLSDGLLLYAFHTKHGKTDPETFEVRWTVDKVFVDDLSSVLKNKDSRIASWLAGLRPKSRVYQVLQQELARLQKSDSDHLELTTTLKPGQNHSQVQALANILSQFNYLSTQFEGESFTPALKKAVIQFQEEHSLEADGVVGPATRWALQALHTGDKDKIRVNLERWRWMPESMGENYISVNIASFNLRYIRAGELALRMKTVVGKSYRKTPVFSSDMRYLVVNPSWNVPYKIASQDLLPKIKADPDFLEKMGMLLFQGWGKEQKPIDPKEVDWARLTSSNFPYNIRQLPGEKNALGRVKFMLPNEHSVYLHDTNDKSLFNKSARAFSSGCIRLENPIELLELISKNHAGVNSQRVKELLDSGKESTILLKEPLPVHIQYWTVWVDDDTRLHYRYDIYERDSAILKSLQVKTTEDRG